MDKLGNITLYNADCMEIMKGFADNQFGLAIIDPPYGGNDAIGLNNNNNFNKQSAKRTDYKLFENKRPSKEYFEELFRVSKNQIIWGVNFYNNYDLTGGRLVWDKKGTAFGRAELAYLSMTKSVNICEITWNGMLQENMKNKEIRIHPTQKPVALYKWILDKYAKQGQTILDTHLGSGSSAIAAHDYGYEFTGIELDSEYYEAAKKRISEHQRQLSMF